MLKSSCFSNLDEDPVFTVMDGTTDETANAAGVNLYPCPLHITHSKQINKIKHEQ